MNSIPPRGRPAFRSSTIVLLLLVLGINVVAIVTIVAARGRARAAAAHELGRSAERHAETLAGALGAARTDLQFLARTRSLLRLLDPAAGSDPYRTRWNRLDAEAAVLLFLRSHPAIERIVALGPQGEPLLSVGRRGGAPIALPPPSPNQLPLRSPHSPFADETGLRLLVDLAPDRLLAASLPAVEASLIERDRTADPDATDRHPDHLHAAAPVDDSEWHPAVAWTLELRGTEGALVRSLEHLTTDLRNTVILNVVLVTFASALGLLAFRKTRKSERLAAERANLEHVRNLELGLLHKDRLASLGAIAAGIAHEINNPLEGMSNYLRMVREDVDHRNWSAARRNLDGVDHGLERITSIVRQTLSQAGDGRGRKERIDANEVVQRAVSFMRDDPRAEGPEIEWTPLPEPAPIVANIVTLGQLVLNLLKNAREAQPAGGEVTARVQRRDGHVFVVVEDRGPGLDDAALARIFDPFYSTKDSTGLGLFLCHAIATDHRGDLKAERRDGGGARFILALPDAAKGDGR